MSEQGEDKLPWVSDQTVGQVLESAAERFPDGDAPRLSGPGPAVVMARAERAGQPGGVGTPALWECAPASTSGSGR